MVGHVLAHSPHDPSGFWLDHSVAKVLNAKDAKELRIGFRLELFNSRGVHAIDPKGKDEEALAKKYNMQAEEVEAHGYHRLADSLRELASMHKREGERQISRDDFDD